MSTELYVGKGQHLVALTEYSGGDKGLCIQITGLHCDKEVGYVGMTKEEAQRVGIELLIWSKEATYDT